jgi:iron complex transport system permease protein
MEKRRERQAILISGAVLLVLFFLSACAGRFSITPAQLIELVTDRLQGIQRGTNAETVLWDVRIPRILAAILIGGCLSLSGSAYQGVFRNPMVSPDLLGASAGAGFGAALGILLGVSPLAVQLIAFGTGITAVVFTWLLHRTMGGDDSSDRILLVLSGVVTSALFQALISIVKYVADPFDTMPSISFWLMGGLTYVTGADVKFLLIPAVLGGIPILLIRWKLNLLAFEADEAAAMGISIRIYRGMVIFCATLMTAACVAVGGMIGWVGLIIPHFARIAVGPDYQKMLPLAAIFGGVFLLLVDDMARLLFAQELPIGILTALAGAPVFALLLIRRKGGILL